MSGGMSVQAAPDGSGVQIAAQLPGLGAAIVVPAAEGERFLAMFTVELRKARALAEASRPESAATPVTKKNMTRKRA